MLSWCADVGCCYDLSGVSEGTALLRGLTFLASELQAARAAAARTLQHAAGNAHSSHLAQSAPLLVAAEGVGVSGVEPMDMLHTGRLLCSVLSVPSPNVRKGGDAQAVEQALARALAAVVGRVRALLAVFPGGSVPHTSPLLPASLQTAAVQDILSRVNVMLRSDYSARRAMLVKRLSVTMQSLLWGEGASTTSGGGGSLAAEAGARLASMAGEPPHVAVEDVFEAGPELLHLAGLRVTSTPPHSAVKGVVIGAVPDRGGRAGEMRPSASDHMPAWMTKRAPDSGRGRGRGGSRGGGRGGRGGGASKQASSAASTMSSGSGDAGGHGRGGRRGGGRGGGRKKRGRD